MNRDTLEIVERIIIENTRSDVERFGLFCARNYGTVTIRSLVASDLLKAMAKHVNDPDLRSTSYYLGDTYWWRNDNVVPFIRFLYEFTDAPWQYFTNHQ